MQRLTKLWLIIGILGLSMSVSTVYAARNQQQRQRMAQQAKPIMVSASKPEVQVKLPVNPSTGYLWFLRGQDQNLDLVSYKIIPPAKKGLIGAGGTAEWTFSVNKEAFIAPRAMTLQFVMMRPWEAKPVQQKRIVVITEANG